MEERIRKIIERVLTGTEKKLIDIEIKPNLLRVYIDKPGGVSVEDCAEVSRELSDVLDVEENLFTSNYRLEVSSPGGRT